MWLVWLERNRRFISIDCGIPDGYTDETTNIYYSSDANFVDNGINSDISAEYKTGNLDRRLANLRSFPQGIRSCYTLRPQQGKNNNYLMRAWFLYGNYDGKKNRPRFDMYIGVNLWDRVQFLDDSEVVTKEIMYVASTNYIHVCVIDIGLGTPFISALELKHLNNSIYKSQSGGMVPYERKYMGSYGEYIDELGRIWTPYNWSNSVQIDTFFPIDSLSNNDYKLPEKIMKHAVKPLNASLPLQYYLDQGGTNSISFYVYLHFCELEKLQDNAVREFDILLNWNSWVKSVVPSYLKTNTSSKESPVKGGASGELWLSIERTKRSTLPPILNAMEVYVEKDMSELPTDAEDFDAMVNISLTYRVKKNWQGDPCKPMNSSWNNVNCSYNGNNSPKITSLNLSSTDLTGEIAPALFGLKSLKYLDLSYNSLTGPVPQFLSELPALEILNLTSNNLTGSVPKALMEKSSLLLITDGNPNLCRSDTCEQATKKKKKNQSTTAIVASVVSSIVFLSAIAILWSLKRRKHKGNVGGRTLKLKNRRFSYSEVVSITNNFERVIGKGGFGTVYLGYLKDGTEVAVKMLSRSSSQGSEQFWTEAELLTTVHHRNLAALIGYCDEGSNTALIYEYMINGNLQECLLDKKRAVLTWEQRLQIAIDAAQALEYLHDGCKPPIIHRDIKTANILLNEKLQAKVADFGLSRIFPVEDGSHVSTAVVGTFGYLDPEYYITSRLTEKSDVYSFGVVLFELITGQPAIIKSCDNENTHIVQWVMPMLERGEISNIVDPRLQGDFDSNSVWKTLETAMACVPSSSIQRPTMSRVVGELKECLEIHVAMSGKDLDMTEANRMTSSNAIDNFASVDLESSMSFPQAR
ncbi:putative leucine-rich repeat receptor-like serine/threonine-protein kinase At2g19230 isoform X3 [Camellia sinensis]|uniref:putative leucine-rich repeat receptor-like serine/threonine-protein kinase At2g19230 isoform X3 n=1 Tax=Camellia sinensis TaxID=4442 RepID=UPI00103577D3|nr:putative leucine-rich repeat receptor-like serine/threonine-protein kinase At2g19230 isoform X3 [Camellia sinensis]